MANCLLNKNILKENVCGYSLLSVIDIYLANYSQASVNVSGNTVTGFSTGTTFYHIEPSKNSASFTDELQVTDGGAKFRTQTLNFSVDAGNYTSDMVEFVDDIALGRYVAVVKLANGKYIMLGRISPLEATSSNVSGAATATEASAIQVVMTSDGVETSMPLSDDAITALLASVPTSTNG